MSETRYTAGKVLLGRGIRQRRQELGLSMRDLSARSGLNYNTVVSIEHGRYLASLKALDVIGQVLGVTARTLLQGVFPWDGGEPPASTT